MIKMTEIIRDSISDQNSLKCTVCYQNPITLKKKYFFQCYHQDACLKCCEKIMLQSLDDSMNPKCFFPECQANIRQDQDSVLNYFQSSSKAKWSKFIQQQSSVLTKTTNQLLPCKTVNCKGSIKMGKCIKCSANYCRNCSNFEHNMDVNCSQNKSEIQSFKLPQNKILTKCPKCNEHYIKEGGCMRMKCGNSNCGFQWCVKCNAKWSFRHHACDGVKSIKLGISGFFAQKQQLKQRQKSSLKAKSGFKQKQKLKKTKSPIKRTNVRQIGRR